MTQHTKALLGKSLVELMDQKPLSKITISDIVNHCGLSRMTFYYHFQDIQDLLSWIFLSQGQKVVQDSDHYKTWQDVFLKLCRTVQENREFVISVYHSVPLEQITNYVCHFIRGIVAATIAGQADQLAISENNRQFIISFYTFAFTGITLEWVKNGLTESPEELTQQISTLVDGQIELTLKNFAAK